MLELLLTRPNERKALIQSAKNLHFLVLDELQAPPWVVLVPARAGLGAGLL